MLIQADARALPLRSASVSCVVTSPPYYRLRDYGVTAQIGREATVEAYVAALVDVFGEVWRVLREDGTVWLNLGDSYAASGRGGGGLVSRSEGTGRRRPDEGFKEKDLLGIPWRVAFALQAAGWHLRADVIWSKPNPMPESVTDRPTRSHEFVFLLSKSARYFYDKAALCEPYAAATIKRGRSIRQVTKGQRSVYRFNGEPLDPGSVARGRNARSVWTIPAQPCREAHFAVMPEALVARCIAAGSRAGDLVLDPFMGSGTVGRVALALGRRGVGCELNREYLAIASRRVRVQRGLPLEAPALAGALEAEGLEGDRCGW